MRPLVAASRHPIGTLSGLSPNTGPLATASWLLARGLSTHETRWYVAIVLDTLAESTFDVDMTTATRFQLEIFAEEWGFMFCHAGQMSWIRVTDIPFVHGKDDHGLLGHTPPLGDIATLIHTLEERHDIAFGRDPLVRTSLLGAEAVIADWARRF
jgi:hypothetical protein